MKEMDLSGSEDHACDATKEERERYRQIAVLNKKGTDGYIPQNNSYNPEFRAAIQERQRVSAADPSAPPNIPKLFWQQQQQSQPEQKQGSRVRLQAHLESETAGRNPTRDDFWPSWWNQSKMESRGTKNDRMINLLFRRIGHQRWRSFCDRQEDTTPSTAAHFKRFAHSGTPSHAVTVFLRGSALSLCALEKVICSHSGLHPSLA